MSEESWPRRVYDFFLRNWLLSAFISLAPGWLSIVLRYKGDAWGLQGSQGLTTIGETLFWVIPAASFVFLAAKFGADNYDSRIKTAGHIVLQKLLDGVNAVTRSKLSRFESFVAGNGGNGSPADIFENITQPEQQIERGLENIQITLSQIMDIPRDDIGVSVIVRAPDTGTWDWVGKTNVENELDLATLVGNPCSSARQVIDGKKPALFWADKKLAREAKEYVPGPRDEAFYGSGSIVVRDISLRAEGRTILLAILSISTHGRQLCLHSDERSKRKISQLILPPFESRLRLELCLLFLKRWSGHDGVRVSGAA